ncbi:TonB-dependent receptor [Hymenobacter chitinivorans]|uniref:Outer membrane receptor for ferrienterochelin and colicins n=1 Tax=Hymenobacter chitinivorans DSM 11115 TaxID=1121954 RepID=A0A2M9B4S2_9BACT|nr:TonB-dependent receptor [Hymenobacter chitinivorans]PJJ52937.1 outer membrane receptor for ferrienterochelin and colicins [Hymenobacter chitinivorans DSM 11115]
MRLIFTGLFLLLTFVAQAQHELRAVVQDSLTREPLPGVTAVVPGSGIGASTDAQGRVTLPGLPAGSTAVAFSLVGYRGRTLRVTLPQAPGAVLSVRLATSSAELGEVIVTSTRTNSRIEDLPTRIEVLGAEEIEEEGGLKPGNIVSLLGDVAGIQAQPTSVTTGSTDLRIQGLSGKYTQLLRDGVPLFGGFAGSFGILQIPPLDLRQVEIIKGASSTLYGGGAIAGMINLVSREPQLNAPERTFLVNQSTLRETNLNGFVAARNEKLGYTLFAGGTRQQAVDVDKDGFSDLPRLRSFLLHPRLFWYPAENQKLIVGYTGTYEERRGGDVQVLGGQPDARHQFFISNTSWRHTADARYENTAASGNQLLLKANLSDFQRTATTNTTGLDARQLSYYTEASELLHVAQHTIVAGLNVTGESFRPRHPGQLRLRSYDYVTPGLFAQDDWKPTAAFTLQTGLRLDHHNQYGTFVLPRVSGLLQFSPAWSARVGGGLGYKAPTFFANELDERDYANLLPFAADVQAEQSAGANVDVNFQTKGGSGEDSYSLTVNQSFFLTRIAHPLLLSQDDATGLIRFFNAPAPFVTQGFETYVRYRQDETELYLGYLFTDARRHQAADNPYLSLIARHKVAGVGTVELGPHWRVGVEASYIGQQYLDNGRRTPGYFITAGMLRYTTGPVSFVLNGENLLDYRQTRREAVVLSDAQGSFANPGFRQLWAPVEGRVLNLSMTLKL